MLIELRCLANVLQITIQRTLDKYVDKRFYNVFSMLNLYFATLTQHL